MMTKSSNDKVPPTTMAMCVKASFPHFYIMVGLGILASFVANRKVSMHGRSSFIIVRFALYKVKKELLLFS